MLNKISHNYSINNQNDIINDLPTLINVNKSAIKKADNIEEKDMSMFHTEIMHLHRIVH